jgi:hypothetical protein
MKTISSSHIEAPYSFLSACCITFLVSLVASPIFAAATGPGDIVTGGCMQDIAGFELGCTANDVRVSGVADITGDGIVDENDITFRPVCDATAANAGTDCSANASVCVDGDGISVPELCGDKCAFPGDTTTFSATFIFELSAQKRWDVAGFFEVTPDTTDDGALTGSCDIVTLPEDETLFTRPGGSTGNFVDLDTGCRGGPCPQPEDLCGDINYENSPILYDMQGSKPAPDMITATCIDPDGDGKLNLPNCTSWRQKGANEVCLDGFDTFPGAPSKCNCDPNFQVPIEVPAATITVVKDATPTEVDEPGNAVKFDVSVANDSLFAEVAIDTLSDDIYGNITLVAGDITSTTCTVPQTVGAGEMYTCSFMAPVSGQGNTSHTDIVKATGMDENQNTLEDSDDATVTIANVPFNFTVDKSVDPDSLPEPGGNFTFTVLVSNTSAVDDLTMTALLDDIYGDLNGKGDCSVPQTIVQGGSYRCSFTVTENEPPGFSQTDTVTATATDEEGPSADKSDTATIQITNIPSTITLVKTASPASFNEPSADVTYTFMVTNDATVDTVTIDTLTDDILGNLNGQGDCSVPQDLAPNGGSYSCTVTVEVSGNAGDIHTNVATASGQDDDASPVSDMDDATVNINDAPPAASLTKEPTEMAVTYDVMVTNDSAAEALSLDQLLDDQFGDITQADSVSGPVLSTDCTVPQSIAVGGNYSCTFVGKVTTSPHTNTVTGTVSDDEGTEVTPSDSATVTFQSNL